MALRIRVWSREDTFGSSMVLYYQDADGRRFVAKNFEFSELKDGEAVDPTSVLTVSDDDIKGMVEELLKVPFMANISKQQQQLETAAQQQEVVAAPSADTQQLVDRLNYLGGCIEGLMSRVEVIDTRTKDTEEALKLLSDEVEAQSEAIRKLEKPPAKPRTKKAAEPAAAVKEEEKMPTATDIFGAP